MKLIHHGRNDTIRINNNEYRFCDFLKLEPRYSVSYDFPIRVYEKGVRHYITDGRNTVYLPLDDPYCDKICLREDELARLVKRLERETEGTQVS